MTAVKRVLLIALLSLALFAGRGLRRLVVIVLPCHAEGVFKFKVHHMS